MSAVNSGNDLAENAKPTNVFRKPISLGKAALILTVIVLGLFGSGIAVQDYFTTKEKLNKLEAQQTTSATLGAADTDPYIRCGPGQNSGQYVNDRQSACANYTDCQLNDGSWKLMKKTECDALQRRAAPVAIEPKIDCIGPDGKHLQITQKECDDFNAAWGKHSSGQENKTVSCFIQPSLTIAVKDQVECDRARATFPGYSTNSSPTAGNTVYCWNNTYRYGYYTSSGDKCNEDNMRGAANALCQDTQKIKLNSCNSQCQRDHDENKAVCAWAYPGGNEESNNKYGECLNGPGGVGEVYGACLDKCTNQYTQDLKQC